VILFLALAFVGGSAYMLAEVATHPARLKARSIRRAVDYGRLRLPLGEQELVRFRERVLLPAAARLASIPLRLNPRTSMDALQRKLVAAGLSQRLSVKNFLTIKGGATLGGVFLGLSMGAIGSFASAIVFAPVFGAAAFIAPDWFLRMKTRGRREAVRSELPDALDLLAVSVEAGLGFDGAVTKLTEYMDGALIDEFALMLNEIRVGEARPEALRKMADRVDARELSTFVRAVLQADQLGISLGRILRIQASDTRLRRQQAAEEKAMKAPIKMLFPTVMFIFPAMFIVVLGPAMLIIMKVFGS
jgi:tight adherence protein C